jgi:hypothetical protein
MREEGHLDPTATTVFRFVAWASLLVITAVFVYGIVEALLNPGLAIGSVLVDVYWPFPPYFAQPVTYFSVACVALFYSGLRLSEGRIARWPRSALSVLQLLGFIVAFSSAYEIMYNFMLWGASYSVACASAIASHTACNPDVIFSTYPVPWNLVFATRAYSALFVISGYSVYFMRRISGSTFI